MIILYNKITAPTPTDITKQSELFIYDRTAIAKQLLS